MDDEERFAEKVREQLDAQYDVCIRLLKNENINYNGLVLLESFLNRISSNMRLSVVQEELLEKFEDYYSKPLDKFSVKHEGYVYFFRMGRGDGRKTPIKIGYSKAPAQRVKQLRTGNPEIKMLHCVKTFKRMEKLMHSELADKRYNGEWFLIDGDSNTKEGRSAIVAYLMSVYKKINSNIDNYGASYKRAEMLKRWG